MIRTQNQIYEVESARQLVEKVDQLIGTAIESGGVPDSTREAVRSYITITGNRKYWKEALGIVQSQRYNGPSPRDILLGIFRGEMTQHEHGWEALEEAITSNPDTTHKLVYACPAGHTTTTQRKANIPPGIRKMIFGTPPPDYYRGKIK